MHVSKVVRSYRDLPLILYHIQVKERDEPRPRAGVLRTREFIMKDSYTFDRDADGLQHGYELHIQAYDRIFDRCGLEWYRVESDVGMMGGLGAHEYMAPCPAGENEVALSASGYAANMEVASATPQPVTGLTGRAAEPVETPGANTIETVSQMLGVPAGALIKAFPVVADERGPVLVLTRGDHRLNEVKLRNALGAGLPPGAGGRGGVRVRAVAGLHRPDRRAGPDAGRRGTARPPGARRRRERAGQAPDTASSRAATSTPSGRTSARLRRRHRLLGRRDPDRAGDRGRQHLQARHALLRAARRDLPRRERQGAARSGWALRHRPRTDSGRRGRAVRRRAGNLMAALDRPMGRRARDAGQGG